MSKLAQRFFIFECMHIVNGGVRRGSRRYHRFKRQLVKKIYRHTKATECNDARVVVPCVHVKIFPLFAVRF